MTPDYWNQATRALSRHDPVMKKLIAAYKGETLVGRGDAFYTLARSIAGQQISVKAADSVWSRMQNGLCDITPATVGAASEETLRGFGLSGSKIRYLSHLAEFFLNNNAHTQRWGKLDDELLIAELTALKGIGIWTAEMFLIFHLMRPDVFPLADLGVQKAIFRHYNNGEPMTKEELLALAETWRPWRTVATWYLWRALDPVPVEY